MHDSQNDDQMHALHSAVSNLHRFDSNPNSINNKHVTRQCIDLIAKIPTVVAYNYNSSKRNWNLVEPLDELSTAQNFLYMLDGNIPSVETARIFDTSMMLHAEHGGGNNSTFTVRAVSSSGADTYMAISSGIASLSGHLHGGANKAVIDMIEDMKKNIKDIKDDDEVKNYLKRILDKEAGDGSGKIYGIGHAVYTKSDPRAVILKHEAEELSEKVGREDELGLYNKIERYAPPILKKEKGKIVSPNVDFYSGFVYDMIGIPKELFTPIFAMSRVTGWCSHRLEQIIQGRIMRPGYVPATEEREYVSIHNRD